MDVLFCLEMWDFRTSGEQTTADYYFCQKPDAFCPVVMVPRKSRLDLDHVVELAQQAEVPSAQLLYVLDVVEKLRRNIANPSE